MYPGLDKSFCMVLPFTAVAYFPASTLGSSIITWSSETIMLLRLYGNRLLEILNCF